MYDRISRQFITLAAFLALALPLFAPQGLRAAEGIPAEQAAKHMQRLDSFAKHASEAKKVAMGYPVNHDTKMTAFYAWYGQSGLAEIATNNVGDPFHASAGLVGTHEFEREVVTYFAEKFYFPQKNFWGFVTSSGTDGNSHGMYYGRKYLQSKSELPPVVYVSEEAHYSIKRLADVQGMELRLIKADPMGRMDVQDFAAQLDPKRPVLLVVAMGTTFKGAIDDQDAINAVLEKAAPPAIYRHLDAALFGSYLPLLPGQASDLVNQQKLNYNSIAISGHKFWGLDAPCGVFITTMEVRNSLNPFHVEYLSDAVPTITCSRSALDALKLWWKISFTPESLFRTEAQTLMDNAKYLHSELQKIGVKAWLNKDSNTVFFERPSEAVLRKFGLAQGLCPTLGKLAHVLVMQHVGKPQLDAFVQAVKADRKP